MVMIASLAPAMVVTVVTVSVYVMGQSELVFILCDFFFLAGAEVNMDTVNGWKNMYN